MRVDDRTVAEARLERTVAIKFSLEDGSVGYDTGTPLIDDYRPPFTYDAKLRSVTVELQAVQTPSTIEGMDNRK